MERTPCREREAHEEVGLSAVALKMIVWKTYFSPGAKQCSANAMEYNAIDVEKKKRKRKTLLPHFLTVKIGSITTVHL